MSIRWAVERSRGGRAAGHGHRGGTSSSCDRSAGAGVIRYAGSVAWRERIDNLDRVPVLSVQHEPGPPGPDLIDVSPDILVCDPCLEFLPDLKFLVIKKLLSYPNDIVQELSD